jgi:predicted transcriptional regulator
MIMSTTIRVSEATRSRFAALARQTGRPMTQLLDEAADALERDLFFHGLERRYEQLHRDEEAWGEIEDERRVEASSLRDQSQ